MFSSPTSTTNYNYKRYSMDTIVDWQAEYQSEIDTLRGRAAEAEARLRLATNERDGLMRESLKVVAYFKKEMKAYKRSQKTAAYLLARKYRNLSDQLELVRADRDQLLQVRATAQMMARAEGGRATIGALRSQAAEGQRGGRAEG